jgi:hypothetical protein
MHVGQDSAQYLKAGYQVVAIEANPDMVEKAKLKFSKQLENSQFLSIRRRYSRAMA